MRPARFLQITAVLALACGTQSAEAQVGQLNQPNAGNATLGSSALTSGGTVGGQGAGPAGGGTTEGPAGLTTEGLLGGDADGGVAGANVAETFIGGNNAGAFVGGLGANQNNSNRQFRAITDASVPTGGNVPTGTQRRIPVSLRIAFSFPASEASSLLIPTTGPPIERVMIGRPELRSVAVNIDAKGVATLTGQVATADAARLAANLLRLRPGVRKVQNQLAVTAP